MESMSDDNIKIFSTQLPAKPAAKRLRVRAKKNGLFIEGALRYAGATFLIDEKNFNADCLEKVVDVDPADLTGGRKGKDKPKPAADPAGEQPVI